MVLPELWSRSRIICRTGSPANLLFLAGQGPRDDRARSLSGKVGAEISIEEGYRRARLSGCSFCPP